MGQPAKLAALSVLAITGALAGCDPATYTDIHFGTDVGADYMAPAPIPDAGEGANDAATPVGAAGSSGGAGGAGGAGGGT
jgi:hypothetical protein